MGPAFFGAKNGGGGNFARLAPFSGLFGCFFRGLFSGLEIIIILVVVFIELKSSEMVLNLADTQRSPDRVNGFEMARLSAFGGAQGFVDRDQLALPAGKWSWLELSILKLEP